jgi:ParB family chromosome partitioning protein
VKSKSTCFSTVKTQRWKISKLRPHPRQAECFSNLSDVELKELAASMRRWGLLQPIHILPDGTIIGGHQRYRSRCII